ncbi:LOW QUALITY PROTEIN: calcium-binding tyrosine phosphorylation-regulated protein [Falco cherrug]|uniref:LOW QUALITY PROTEIN: calcium-binding tyrosine phosphorylation-regulated protein n=1 Tax=Falco cherrug TaxID=345164 RepID=UPI002478FD99|nr:LOW QUALITY PROTEIN: calcium-binding tyrosine phosphorylation-regulated protein [Falco cherrug]
MVSSEAGQLPPHSNVWTFCHLTDLRPGQKSPPSVSPAGAGVPYSQSTLSLPWREGHQCGQLSQVSAPISVMQEESKRSAPPFISVGSNVQNTQDWKPIPRPAVFAQQEAGARRFTTVLVSGARPAVEETDTASPNSNSAEETAVKPCTPGVFSVAIPLDDAIPTKKRFPADAKRPGINALAESYGTTGQITITPGPLARAGS